MKTTMLAIHCHWLYDLLVIGWSESY